MKNRFKYLWISITISFLLSIQYIERYTDGKNRMLFHWNHWDGLAIVFSAFLVGLLFYSAYLLAKRFKSRHIIKAFESIFIAILGIAIVKDIEHWLFKSSNYNLWLQLTFKSFIYFLYGAVFCALCIYLFRKTKKIRKGFVTLCLILSPIIPVFLITSFSYKTWIPSKGKLPCSSKLEAENIDKPNTYIFVFDEWSYKRSYEDNKLLPIFKNLAQFKESSILFHQAYSPYRGTFRSLPSLIFQNSNEFDIKDNQLFFKTEGEKIRVDEIKSIFAAPHRERYFTALVGEYLPYADFLGDDVDFVKSISVYKMPKDDFLSVTSFHLLKSLVLYSFHFLPRTAKLAEEVYANQHQLRTTSTIHQQALSIIKNVNEPTFVLFHYSVPHGPCIFDQQGPKEIFHIYKENVDNYMDNLAYLDKIIGEILLALQQADKYENSLIVMTSDHSWRLDPDASGEESDPKERHVPLFIKLPNQKEGYETDDELVTAALFEFIKQYR